MYFKNKKKYFNKGCLLVQFSSKNFFWKDSINFQCWKMTLKIRILRCLRRLFISLVCPMMTWFSEKCLFPLDAYVVLCPTLTKNLWRYLPVVDPAWFDAWGDCWNCATGYLNCTDLEGKPGRKKRCIRIRKQKCTHWMRIGINVKYNMTKKVIHKMELSKFLPSFWCICYEGNGIVCYRIYVIDTEEKVYIKCICIVVDKFTH